MCESVRERVCVCLRVCVNERKRESVSVCIRRDSGRKI